MTSYAHSGTPGQTADWQGLDEHLQATADLAAERAARFGLSGLARLAGALHDFGKHDPAFQRRLQGDAASVDHSTAGAALLKARARGADAVAAELLGYAILGHHAGLPDKTGADSAMERRLDRYRDAVPPGVTAGTPTDLAPLLSEVTGKMRPGQAGFDLSLAGRMVFSCLVDADFRDTEAYYCRLEGRGVDRLWPGLPGLLPELRAALDARMARFPAESTLNRLRGEVLAHIRSGAAQAPGLFTLTVPTGGGKTLASLAFALDHAARHGHRRIIYAIPYTSIIEQTAAVFRDVFAGLGEVVLEHHASIDSERPGLQGRDKARLAMEDWAAPLVVTTNVQLFESLFAARPSRCRKLHNIAGSVIVLDEAQSLPRPLLMPTLRMIEALAAHYGCSVVLCTATQPAFDSRELKSGGLPLEGRELAPDPPALARRLRRARIHRAGPMEDDALVEALRDTPQGMVIVNSRKHALDLYQAVQGAGLEGAVHLTTRQYPAHRQRLLADIRQRLKGRAPCRLIATSLIEAGVDVDFPKGWRAETGLDSIVQSAGRVNREGRHPLSDSTLTVFEAPGRPVPATLKPLIEAMRLVAGRHEDLLSPEAIRDWFCEVYWKAGAERMGQQIVEAFTFSPRHASTNFAYRSTAEAYRMIDSPMVPVIVAPADEAGALAAVARLAVADVPSGLIARQVQRFTVQVPQRARDILRVNGKGDFAAPDLRGDQFFVLSDLSLYRQDVGLLWEDAGYIGDGIW